MYHVIKYKMINAFKSRTNWTVIIMVATAVVQTAEPMMDAPVFALLMSILGALAVYFRTIPAQHAE